MGHQSHYLLLAIFELSVYSSLGHQLIGTAQSIFVHASKSSPTVPVPWSSEANGGQLPSIWTHLLKGDDEFKAEMQALTGEYVFVDFYSPYCPHCQHFAPELERTALAAQKAGISVDFAKVDCIAFVNTCKEYMMTPDLPAKVWGRRDDWINGNKNALENVALTGDSSSESLVSWLHSYADLQLDVVDRDQFNKLWVDKVQQVVGVSEAPADQCESKTVNAWDMQLAVALFIHKAIETGPSYNTTSEDNDKAFDALVGFVELLAERYPDRKCRSSLSDAKSKMRRGMKVDEFEASWRLCDTDWDSYRTGWEACKPTWPGARGYTCGLWSLFHMLAATGEDDDALKGFKAVRESLYWYFDCHDCHEHFFSLPAEDSDAATKRDAQLWWWHTHNKVNKRVGEEESYTGEGDPGYPKVQWPPTCLCSDCQKSSLLSQQTAVKGLKARRAAVMQSDEGDAFHDGAVVDFLTSYYGS